jgi:hypothetical protein
LRARPRLRWRFDAGQVDLVELTVVPIPDTISPGVGVDVGVPLAVARPAAHKRSGGVVLLHDPEQELGVVRRVDRRLPAEGSRLNRDAGG